MGSAWAAMTVLVGFVLGYLTPPVALNHAHSVNDILARKSPQLALSCSPAAPRRLQDQNLPNSPANTGSITTQAMLHARARRHPALRLMAHYGSRARGNAHERSDWDFAYLADPGLDEPALLLDLVTALGCDAVDLCDLDRASAVLRMEVACEGRIVYERSDDWNEFRLNVADFWCDAGPVIARAQAEFLSSLDKGART